MKGHFLFTSLVAAGFFLPAAPTFAQLITGSQYLPGTEGIQAGTLPGPGFYFDDINVYGYSSQQGVDHASTYINEPRFRWITPLKLLGANYGMELLIPWLYQEQTVHFGGFFPNTAEFKFHEVEDLEISPLLLSWHLKHFDFSAGYSLWVPTDDNKPVISGGDVEFLAQAHYWENMFTLGGTWHPDADKKWSVSALNHYEISQSYKTIIIPTRQGQQFTMEWGVSRTVGGYFELGAVGNYSWQTTNTRVYMPGPFGNTYYPGCSNVEVGPEVKFTLPHCGFSTSLRYLHDFSTEPGYDRDVVALSLSKRF